MSTTAEIVALPEAEMMRAIADKPHAYFKTLKSLPDIIAGKLYKDFACRWAALEARVKELEALVAECKFDDRSVEENRYDIISELMDKTMQGFEIVDEHAARKVPLGHRLVLEAKMLEAMSASFDRIESLLRDFYGKSEDYARIERDDLRMEIRLMDMCYVDVHTSFLKSYLEHDW